MESKGQYLVGANFNPGGDHQVAVIKLAAAALIDVIDAIPTDDLAGAERARLKALAITSAEQAAMWAVKAATKPARS